MRDAYLMQPSVTRNPDELIRAIGRRRRRALLKAWASLGFGVGLLAAFCAWLLSDSGHRFLLWLEGVR